MLLNYSVLVDGDKGTRIYVCSCHCSKETERICECEYSICRFCPQIDFKESHFTKPPKTLCMVTASVLRTCVNHMHIDMLGVAGAWVTLVLAAVILKADNIKIQIITICSALTGVAWLMMRLEVVWSPLSLMTTVPPRSRS